MINGNNGTSSSDALGVDIDGWRGESGVDTVNWNGVVRVGRTARISLD